MKIGIAFGMVAKAAMVGGTILRDTAQIVAEAVVEAPGLQWLVVERGG